MSKRVRVSDDSGSNWYTLPGSSGERNSEAGDIEDTIFGQDYASSQTGLITNKINANGLYKGFAGYVATIKKTGTPTSMTDEPMSLVSGKTYKTTATTKNVWSRLTTPTIKDNSVAVAGSNIQEIDYLFGRVTFVAGYSPTGPITVTGNYLPMTALGKSNGFTLTQTANAIQTSDFETVQGNDGHHTYRYGLKTVSIDLQGIHDAVAGLRALLVARTELVIEINPDGSSKSVARGFFKPMNNSQSGDVGDLETETTSFNLSVPDQADIAVPYKWLHTSTTLNTALQKCLTSWTSGTELDVQYLYDGTNGVEGSGIITDLTLAGGLEVMNEFTVNFQLSGALTAVP